jgi:D-alanyl-D-alanine carboxypeptidase/D-alanyl-D-alanine-endopeptidase (penicillin-binding protein 4)
MGKVRLEPEFRFKSSQGSVLSEGKEKFAYFKQIAIGSASGVVTLALIIAGFSISGASSSSVGKPSESASQSASPTPSVTSSIARTCSVATEAADPRLGTFSAVVINAATDEVLFDRNAATPASTASTMKMLTAAAALQVLGPNYRVETKVYQDPANPATIYLVGAGDPTLSRTANGKQSVYKDAPKLSDLAVAVNASLKGQAVSKIVLDSTLFSGPSWEPTWQRSEQTQGYMSEVTALQVDGDRKNPSAETSARSTTPVANAGRYFKAALGASASAAAISEAKMPAGMTQIASVYSQPISQWVKHMLLVSDNTQAEYLARLVSLKQGFDGSFTSLNAAIKMGLNSTMISSANVTIKDGSGLSDFNAVSPTYLAQLSKLILGSQGNYSIIYQGLPIAHESGSLASRFGGDNLDAAGHIIAKTGWIKRGYTLAGIINAKDSTQLTFAIYALGNVKDDAKDAIDNLATAIYRCGNQLSNN